VLLRPATSARAVPSVGGSQDELPARPAGELDYGYLIAKCLMHAFELLQDAAAWWLLAWFCPWQCGLWGSRRFARSPGGIFIAWTSVSLWMGMLADSMSFVMHVDGSGIGIRSDGCGLVMTSRCAPFLLVESALLFVLFNPFHLIRLLRQLRFSFTKYCRLQAQESEGISRLHSHVTIYAIVALGTHKHTTALRAKPQPIPSV